jgi:murein DD-endopeptidase MepM/ murein hydrolase activator NlpD
MIKKRHFVQIISLILISAVLLFASGAQSPADETDIDDNINKIEQLKQQAAKIQKENQALEARINNLRGDINKQNEFIREVNTLIKQIEAQIAAYIELIDAKQAIMDATEHELVLKEVEIENTELRIRQREQDIEALDGENVENIERFGQLIAQIYMNSGNDVIGLLIGAESFYDVLVRTEMIRNIGERNVDFMLEILESIEKQEELIAELLHDREKLETERAELAEKSGIFGEEMQQLQYERAAIAAEVDRQYKALRALTAEKAELQSSVNNISSQVSKAKLQIDGINERIADLERENKRITDRIREQQDPDRTDYSGDGFVRPVNSKFPTTCLFDCERDRKLCSWCVEKGEVIIGRIHTGVDFGNASDEGISGANIFAVQSGTVTMAVTGWGGGYGHYVVIDHGGGITSLYAHMAVGSPFVKVGDEVEKGEVIGRVGNTGWSYGAHLHFEIRKNGTPVNPLNYIPK